MDLEIRLAALSKLIDVDSESVNRRLGEEFRRSEDLLLHSSKYEELREALRTLEILAPRFHMAVLPLLDSFTRSVSSRDLTQDDSLIGLAISRPRLVDDLLTQAIDVSKQVRYLHTEQVVDLLLELAGSASENVRRKAARELEDLAEFDLDIFYERQQGAAPQAKVVAHLSQMDDATLVTNADSVLRILGKVLSPSMEGHSWTYSSVTIRRGSIVSHSGVAEMRANAVALLKRMYALDPSVDFRQRVLRTMDVATRREGQADASETSQMLDRDAISVLEFRRTLVATEALQLVQTIENQTYWDYYHAASPDIAQKALEVRDELAAHHEYQVYKQLIGFDGIFGEWEQLRSSESAWDYSDTNRRAAARQYLEEINDENYALWRSRILEFSTTRSNDLATFPIYYDFLESIGRERPRLALELVATHAETMAPFLIPLLRGLWTSSQAAQIEPIVGQWIAEGQHLAAVAKSLYKVGATRLSTLDAVIARSAELNQRDALLEALGVAASLFAEGSEPAKARFMQALRELARRDDSQWASVVWFSRDFKALIGSMTQPERTEVLTSLASLPSLDYQAEEVLSAIADQDVESVLDYLLGRLRRARQQRDLESGSYEASDDRFEAIPYQFHKLDKQLSQVPEKMLSALRHEFDEESRGLFTYRGARLIEATFPEFSAPLERGLLAYVEGGDESDIDFVLAVLRAYDGPAEILCVCKEIIKRVPEGSKFWNEIAAAFESTGVVHGEYGLANAYEQKRSEISPWLQDEEPRVRAFAEWLTEGLNRMIDYERKRADEGIALRKYKYGTGSDE